MLVSREGEYWLAIINGRLHWAFANSSPGWTSIDTGYTVRDDRWHHLAVTYSGGVVKSYGDGRLVHTYNGSGTVGDTIDWMNNFLIGHREWGVENDWATQLHGFLDEVRVWGRVLTEAEIRAGMNRHLRGDEPGLIAYWSFDEPEGVAVDRAGGHDGTWIGVGQRSWTPSPFELSR